MFAGASKAANACSRSLAIGCSMMLGLIAEDERGYEMRRYLWSIFSHKEDLKNKDTS